MSNPRLAIPLGIAVVGLAVSSGIAVAHDAGDPCARLGAVTSIRGVVHSCQINDKGTKVWKRTPRAVSTTSTSTTVAPTTTVAVVPFVSIASTFIDSGTHPKAVVVTSNVSGTVYLIEGASPVTKVSDITTASIARWTSAAVVANTPTSVALDVDVLTNGYYRVFVANSAGVLSAQALSKATISISRIGETVTVLSCASGGACAIGDTGPGGGVVFILSTTAGNSTGRTFEAARKDWDGGAQDGTAMWCGGSNASISGLGTSIGTGSTNSSTIATACASTGTSDASEYVRGKTIGGKSDWFLPSQDEALEIYTQRSVFVGNYAINETDVDTARYLTSSQGTSFTVNAIGAYLQGSVAEGTAQEVSKTFAFSVRPVRSFVAG